MPNRRFYTPTLEPGRVSLDAQQANHARRTLRLRPGDAVELFDGAGRVGTGELVDVGRGAAADVPEVHRVERGRPMIDVAVAPPKGHRGDTLVEKLSELGADRLVPLLTDRSVGKPRANKMARYGRIAVEAAKQCGRAWLMEITTPLSYDALLSEAHHDVTLFADGPSVDDRLRGVDGGRPAVRRGVAALPSNTDHALVLIGPEGGWNERERTDAVGRGCTFWELGPSILRVETAAIAAVAVLRATATREAATSGEADRRGV